jgi:F0F1-type ATP synthase membrane subunit b/b'
MTDDPFENESFSEDPVSAAEPEGNRLPARDPKDDPHESNRDLLSSGGRAAEQTSVTSATEAPGALDFDDDYGYDTTETEVILKRLLRLVRRARPVPLSSSVVVHREQVVALIEEALAKLPEELRQARWLIKEQDEFVEQRRREADRLLEDVRAQAERMVQRTEIVREANRVAERIVERARDEARRLRLEVEDFCDKRLAAFEIVLDRTMKAVQTGRDRLRAGANAGVPAALRDLSASAVPNGEPGVGSEAAGPGHEGDPAGRAERHEGRTVVTRGEPERHEPRSAARGSEPRGLHDAPALFDQDDQ